MHINNSVNKTYVRTCLFTVEKVLKFLHIDTNYNRYNRYLIHMFNKRLTTARQSIILYLLLAYNNVLESTSHTYVSWAKSARKPCECIERSGAECSGKCAFHVCSVMHLSLADRQWKQVPLPILIYGTYTREYPDLIKTAWAPALFTRFAIA